MRKKFIEGGKMENKIEQYKGEYVSLRNPKISDHDLAEELTRLVGNPVVLGRENDPIDPREGIFVEKISWVAVCFRNEKGDKIKVVDSYEKILKSNLVNLE